MRISILLIVGVLCCAGCRVNPRAEREIALLRAEILDLEDQYYALKSQCGDSGTSLSSGDAYYGTQIIEGNCENCEPSSVNYDTAPARRENNATSEPTLNDSHLEIQEPVELPDTDSRLESLPHEDDTLPEKISYPRKRSSSSLPADQASIASIVINRRLSKGRDLDGRRGHEGLTLLIQPTDVDGNVHKVAGHLIVRVVETESQNVEREIGLWQFTPAETETFFVKDNLAQQGILLHLPWDGLLPAKNQLSVFVKYTKDNGQFVEASRQIKIAPPARSYSPNEPQVAEWIENDSRWKDIVFDSIDEVSVEQVATPKNEPSFRVKAAHADRREQRISKPSWRPVR